MTTLDVAVEPVVLRRAVAAGQRALAGAAQEVAAAAGRLDSAVGIVEILLETRGRIVVTGLGKSGLVGAKLAATLASTGSPAFFVHAADALHGDAGMVRSDDVLIAISKSGGTSEVVAFAAIVKRRGAKVIAVTGCGGRSRLWALADDGLDVSVEREADPYDLAPTTSTLMTAALGDALAVALMVARGFGPADFHLNHPAGALGEALSQSKDQPA